MLAAAPQAFCLPDQAIQVPAADRLLREHDAQVSRSSAVRDRQDARDIMKLRMRSKASSCVVLMVRRKGHMQ
jgi:hypothetical protein